eukprot:COSAG02_NODE_31886_length_525_cov_3.450704_1_plen_65_part_10
MYFTVLTWSKRVQAHPYHHIGRTVVPAGVSGPESQLEIAAQSSSRIFVELDWAADRKLDWRRNAG